MNEIWTIFMGGELLIPMSFFELAKFEGGINNGVNLNKIDYKIFWSQNFREGELIVPKSFFENGQTSRGELKSVL